MVKKPEATDKTPQAHELAQRAKSLRAALKRCRHQRQFDDMMKGLEARKCSS